MEPQALSKLTPNDPRVSEHTTTLSTGRTYHYLILPPQGKPLRGTILLMHGFPDLPLGWRYQAPAIAALGLRVVIPAMLGYSRTDAPKDPAQYTFRSMAGDMAALAQHVVSGHDETNLPILLGGHDWGGATAWATARLYSNVFSSVFSVSVPYTPPSQADIPIEYAARVHPTIGYMAHFGKPLFEEWAGRDAASIRTFLNAMFTRAAADDDGYFDARVGLDTEALDATGAVPSPLFDEEEMDHYVREFTRSGMHGPLSYYRNRKANFEADKEEAEAGAPKISLPSMFVAGTEDPVVTEAMFENTESHFDNGLAIKRVAAGHWALVGSAKDETTEILTDWLEDVLGKLEAKKAAL